MQEKDVIARINELCEVRSWTTYRLAKESGIPYSTLFTMLHKSNAPSVSSLIRICNGFGITLAQFFDKDSDQAVLTKEEQCLLEQWSKLRKDQKDVILALIQKM